MVNRESTDYRTSRSLFIVILACIIFIYSCATPSILVTQSQQEGDRHFNEHRYEQAISEYEKMLDASSKLGVYRNPDMEADVHRKIANCNEMLGRYERASLNAAEAYRIDSVSKNLLDMVEDLRQLGKIELYRGNNYKAIGFLERSLEKSEGMDESLKNVNRNARAETELALGQLYATMGRFQQATGYTGRALSLYGTSGDKRGSMEALLTLGIIYYNTGDLELSRSITQRSVSLAVETGSSIARHNYNLARISSTLGFYEEALRLQMDALEEAKRYGILAQKVWFTIRLGDLYRDLGDSERSMDLYRQAAEMKDTASMDAAGLQASIDLRRGDLAAASSWFSGEGSLAGSAIAYLRMGEEELAGGKVEKAREYLMESSRLFSESGSSIGMANSQLALGIASAEVGDWEEALRYLDLAITHGNYPEVNWQAAYRKGLVYEVQGDLPGARASLTEAAGIIERIRGNLTIDEFKSKYINNKTDVYHHLVKVMLRFDEPEEALVVTEKAKARAFFEMLANRKIDFREESSDSLISLEQDKRLELQQLYRQMQGEDARGSATATRVSRGGQGNAQLASIQKEYDDILLRLKLASPTYSQIVSPEPVEINMFRDLLDDKTAILSYWLGEETLDIWIITRSGVRFSSVPADMELFSRRVLDARKFIATGARAKADEELRALWDLLVGPVMSDISRYKDLVIIPNHNLHFLPFQALKSGEGEYLVSKFNISYAPSLSVYGVCAEKKTNPGDTFFGAALGDLSIGFNVGLPGTEDEVNRIVKLFPENLAVYGNESTESYVKENSGRFDLVHLATHGIYNYAQPLYSFLLFPPGEGEDGRLTAHEVFGLNLKAKLVTLSACETGLGNIDEGDEIIGLSRSFLYAGSPSVIVSLWSVADYQTSLLMTKFYGYMNSMPLNEALTKAQREVMELYPDPLYWAPFVLIGKNR